jgi:hypothetical protein
MTALLTFRFDGDPDTLVAQSTRTFGGKKLITTVRVTEELARNADRPEIARVIDALAYETILVRVTT